MHNNYPEFIEKDGSSHFLRFPGSLDHSPTPPPTTLKLSVRKRLVDFTLIWINMASTSCQSIVSTEWLNKELKNTKGGLAVLDATWFSDKDACSDFSK